MDTRVLIVGAGPTGLMLAIQLARRGVRPLVIDRHSGPAQQSRAIGVQARTLEIYAHMGLIDDALARGIRATGANMWTSGRWAARIPLADIGATSTPYPFILMLGQDENELIMGERLRQLGVDIRWNTELTALEQKTSHVAAKLTSADRTETVDAAWVVGCDGVHSKVRESCGIDFPGAPYEHVFYVADTEATGAMKPGEVNVYLWKGGFHLFFPMRGADRWRAIGILPNELRHREELRFEELVPTLRDEVGADLNFRACHWLSTYRIHHRAASRFRDGRCFILGDAAHVHSPAGAQGMNTGLQDAYNLAWKLALVATGKADASLLDTFEAERRPVALRLLHTTDRLFQLAVSESWLAGLVRTRLVAKLASRVTRIERIRRLAFRTVSQIGIRYRGSRLSQTASSLPADAPQPGDRFPWIRLATGNGDSEGLFARLDDTKFNLLLIGQPMPEGLASIHPAQVEPIVIAADTPDADAFARAGIPLPSFYLLRPDGHVGLGGALAEPASVKSYLDSTIGLH